MKILFCHALILLLLFYAQTTFGQYVPKEEREKKKEKVKSDTTKVEQNKTIEPDKEEKNQTTKKSDSEKGSFFSRLTFGGNFWLQFGTLTRIDLYPTVGYKFTEKFIAGIGVNYQYLSAKYEVFNTSTGRFETFTVSESYYGGRVFSQYFIIPQIFLWGEVEGINGNFYDQALDQIKKEWIISPLLGGGFNQAFGGRGGIYAMILYNFNYNADKSLYTSPWITRVGFNF